MNPELKTGTDIDVYKPPDEDWSIPVEKFGFINNNYFLVFIFNFVVNDKKQLLVNILKRKFINKDIFSYIFYLSLLLVFSYS